MILNKEYVTSGNKKLHLAGLVWLLPYFTEELSSNALAFSLVPVQLTKLPVLWWLLRPGRELRVTRMHTHIIETKRKLGLDALSEL